MANTIRVITAPEEDARESTTPSGVGFLSASPRLSGGSGALDLDVTKLRDSFARLSGQIAETLEDVRQVGDFNLKQVQFQVEISSEGGVTLIGSLKAGVRGAITLTFEP